MHWKGIVSKLDHAFGILSNNYVSMNHSPIFFGWITLNGQEIVQYSKHSVTSGPSDDNEEDI